MQITRWLGPQHRCATHRYTTKTDTIGRETDTRNCHETTPATPTGLGATFAAYTPAPNNCTTGTIFLPLAPSTGLQRLLIPPQRYGLAQLLRHTSHGTRVRPITLANQHDRAHNSGVDLNFSPVCPHHTLTTHTATLGAALPSMIADTHRSTQTPQWN